MFARQNDHLAPSDAARRNLGHVRRVAVLQVIGWERQYRALELRKAREPSCMYLFTLLVLVAQMAR